MNGTLLHMPLVQCTPAHLYMECPVDPDHPAHHLTLLNLTEVLLHLTLLSLVSIFVLLLMRMEILLLSFYHA